MLQLRISLTILWDADTKLFDTVVAQLSDLYFWRCIYSKMYVEEFDRKTELFINTVKVAEAAF